MSFSIIYFYSPRYSSTNCEYTQKAFNVKARGGKIMLLIDDNNILNDEYNVDDQLSNRIDIPTVIIPKSVGEIIKQSISQPGSDKLIMSIKFLSTKDNGVLDMMLFFRSDDIKALSFFKEFNSYKNILSDKLHFTPIYKYNTFPYEDTDNSIHDIKNNTTPCIKSSKLCSTPNPSLLITNPRVILLENVRQSCIYSLYNIDTYWEYMINFRDVCADTNNPSFNSECSYNVLKLTKSIPSDSTSIELIETCMHNMINEESKIEDDFAMFNKKRVYKTPELMLNGVKYRGTWFNQYMFNSICNGFINDMEICKDNSSKTATTGTSKMNVGTLLITSITLVIVVIMIVLLFCYRRSINRTLEEQLNLTIRLQAMKVIDNYKQFKETFKEGFSPGAIEITNI